MRNSYIIILSVVIFLFGNYIPLKGQTYTISGTIVDGSNGESLIGASIYVPSLEVGSVANSYGFYSLTFPPQDSIAVVFSYLGYKPQIKKVFFQQNITLGIQLIKSAKTLTEVVVSAQAKNDDNVQRTSMGVIDVPIQIIEDFPAILGESDVLKVIQFLPGVQAGQEGTTGFYVRGGNADQNLVLLDEATVYNPNHLFGLLSTFNTKALNNVALIKGGFPANYGGRLSSILKISMKEGNNQETTLSGGIGLIASHLTIEGPIKKDKASYIVSARRTYIDLLLKPFRVEGDKTNYYFYDLNAKANWEITEKDKLFLSFFKGNDDARYTGSSSFDYGIQFGNGTGTLRWNHIFNQKLFANTSLIYNNYFLNLSTTQSNFFAQYYSGIIDKTIKTDYNYYPNPKHTVQFGATLTDHTFASSGKDDIIRPDSMTVRININKIPEKRAQHAAVYITDDYKISSKVGLSLGVRVPAFFTDGTSYYKFEPRAAMKVNLNDNSSIKLSYTQMNQFLHLIPSSTATLPTDIWTPSSKVTKPQFSEQFAIGYFKNFKENEIETSVEIYYKEMKNQVLFKEGAQLLEQTNIDEQLTFGNGQSYGAEFFVKKKYGRLTGWISYTLSWSEQQFDELNNGKVFPFKYDRRHNFTAVASYNLNEKWSLSSDFSYTSGSHSTIPAGSIYVSNGGDLYGGRFSDYTTRNNYQLKAYHRLDVAAKYKKRRRIFKKEYDSELILSLYNVYSRQNPYFVYLTVDEFTNAPVAKQVSLLPIILGVSYNFKF